MEIGFPRCYLTWMCDEGLLTKGRDGVYRVADHKGEDPICSGANARQGTRAT